MQGTTSDWLLICIILAQVKEHEWIMQEGQK